MTEESATTDAVQTRKEASRAPVLQDLCCPLVAENAEVRHSSLNSDSNVVWHVLM